MGIVQDRGNNELLASWLFVFLTNYATQEKTTNLTCHY